MSPTPSAIRSSARPAAGGRAVISVSSRTCSLRESSHGATRKVASGRLYSETSMIHGSVPRPRLRAMTSPVTSTARAPSRRAATTAPAWSTPRYARPIMRPLALEEVAHLRPVLGAHLEDAGPAGLVGPVEVLLRLGALEPDHLDAGLRLTLDLLLRVGLPEVVEALEGEPLAREEVALGGGELVPRVQVDDQRHLGVVEARIDAELGALVPVEVEDAADRPAVAVHDAALERGVHLARGGLHDGGAERGEEVAVHGRDADLEAGEVGLVDLLVEVDVEGLVLDDPGQVVHVALLVPEPVDVVVGAGLALLRDRHLGELERVRLGEDVGVEGAGGHRHVDHAGPHRVADLERRDPLRPADEVEAQGAFAVLVHALDPALEPLHVEGALGERAHDLEGDLLGARRERDGEHGRGDESGECSHGFLLGVPRVRWRGSEKSVSPRRPGSSSEPGQRTPKHNATGGGRKKPPALAARLVNRGMG